MSTTLSLATRARKTASRSSRLACVATAAAFIVVLAALVGFARPAAAQFIQQGPKLLGNGANGSRVGSAVAVSGDGNTAIVGGMLDGNGNIGAAWIFTRSGGVWSEQGSKLVGTGASGGSEQGVSVALSADGNTAIVGGDQDNSGVGAAWIFTRSGGVWSQQGSKLVGTGASGSSEQGVSVALSSDGNTAIVGGNGDATETGAAWIFTRSGGVWSQQGSKLVGTGATLTPAGQGFSVALSSDGNTALVGGPFDANNTGAAWVFTQSGGVWSQQGSKLVGTGNSGASDEGLSVALSADGNTAMLGGPHDNSFAGAVWVFTRSGGVWSQQGSKLVGTGIVDIAEQGSSVALSASGNLALVGAYFDNSQTGAAWVFTRSGGTWIQQGPKLVGTGASGSAEQGVSVSLSADGNVAILGGPLDDASGAAWVFASHIAHDFNDDAVGDILWRGSGGATALWLMNGAQILQAGGFGTVSSTWSIIGQRDFDGSGNADILWRDGSGNLALWLMNGLTVSSGAGLGNVPIAWSVYGTGDLNGDGKGDILWRDTTGDVAIWFMNGATVGSTAGFSVPVGWTIVGDDSHGDIFWHDASGNYVVWQLSGTQILQTAFLGNVSLATWQIAGLGDFNGDGVTDILWRDTAGDLVIWFLNSSLGVQSTASLGNVSTTWTVAQTGDYNGDARTDILWIDTAGDLAVWFMNGGTVISSAGLGNVGTTWQVQSLNAE